MLMAATRLRSLLHARWPGGGTAAATAGAAAATALATLAGPAAAAELASPVSAAGPPGNRYNVGATHSPQLLAELAGPVRAAPTPPPGNAPAQTGTRRGVDVAAYQHPSGAAINWRTVARSGIRFAVVKATEGTYYRNPYARSDIKAARAAGLSVGAYVFAIPNGNGGRRGAVPQADYLLSYLGPLAASVPVMLDIEFNPYSGGVCYGRTGPRMVSWVERFSAEIQARTGRVPYIYTPQGWWNPCTGGSAAVHKNPLWVPNYTTASSPAMPAGWTTWKIWQYSSTGTVPGIQDPGFTDLDRLHRGVTSLGR
jgi:GH25 family lysozyme M1 (1,4-beta-N-acetylmuramidase)